MTENTVPMVTPTHEWACQFCGYIYDEAVGDPEHGIAPGTKWKDVPEDWCCPMCSGEKDGFELAD